MNERRISSILVDNPSYQYGLVVCDVNDLKYINDKFGHDFGDEYLRKACRIICDVYKMSPVFRIGGDEFVVILEGEDFNNRDTLLNEMYDHAEANVTSEDGVLIAIGMAINEEKEGFTDVFHRADRQMYEYKNNLKKMRPDRNLR